MGLFEVLEKDLGIKLTQKDIDALFGLYKEIAGDEIKHESPPKLYEIEEVVNRQGCYRYPLDEKIKFGFGMIISGGIRIYPNISLYKLDEQERQDMISKICLYNTKINKYLTDQKLNLIRQRIHHG